MIHIEFTNETIEELRKERYEHPHVQKKMDALLLKSQGISHKQIGEILGVCQDTLRKYFEQYKSGGIEELKILKFYKPQTKLIEHKTSIEEAFRNNPPATVKEAVSKIETITGLKRSEVQVGKFLKKIGLKRLKVAQIPAKADVKKQAEFLEINLQPKIEDAKLGKCQLLFVDASHFVLAAFLGYLWSFSRVFIKSPSGR